MNRFLNALGKSALTVLIMILVGYSWAFFEIKILLKSNPELVGYIFYQYKSDDMVPALDIDDVIIIKKGSNYDVDELIMYLDTDGNNVIRKVKNISNDIAYVTCDMCNEETKAVQKSTVIGRVIGKIKYFGKFINFFRQRWFLILLAIIGFTFVIVSQYIHEKPKKIS